MYNRLAFACLITAGVLATACGGTTATSDDGTTEDGAALTSSTTAKLPTGTFVADSSARGWLKQITVGDGDAYAVVLRGEDSLERGTLAYAYNTVTKKRTVGIGEGTYNFGVSGDVLTLVSTLDHTSVKLHRDDSADPGSPGPGLSIECSSEYGGATETIKVTFDDADAASGKAVVSNKGDQFFPKTGNFSVFLDDNSGGELTFRGVRTDKQSAFQIRLRSSEFTRIAAGDTFNYAYVDYRADAYTDSVTPITGATCARTR